MIAALAVSALLLTASSAAGGPEAASGPVPPQDPDVTEVDEVVIAALPNGAASLAYVRTVAAPGPGREMALWRQPVCVGVGGLQPEPARMLADHISGWAARLELRVGEPGCRPNILIVASDDGDATARDLVRRRPRDFRIGVRGANAGAAALRAFQSSGAPVRWWHVSLPVDDETGEPLNRLPGQAPPTWDGQNLTTPNSFTGNVRTTSPSLISAQERDDLLQVVIVLDIKALDAASFAQVADYMVLPALARIEAGAAPGYPSILNLFEAGGEAADGLTRWDRAFLRGLYRADQSRSGGRANLAAVADAMRRALEADAAPDESP
jgi:hypothetical protein